jgi:hypothetical protein
MSCEQDCMCIFRLLRYMKPGFTFFIQLDFFSPTKVLVPMSSDPVISINRCGISRLRKQECVAPSAAPPDRGVHSCAPHEPFREMVLFMFAGFLLICSRTFVGTKATDSVFSSLPLFSKLNAGLRDNFVVCVSVRVSPPVNFECLNQSL